MADIFQTLNPALQVNNPSGQAIIGPVYLAPRAAGGTTGLKDYGVLLRSCDIEYPHELLGPWFNPSYEKRFRFLGYRPLITLQFDLVIDDSTNASKGLALLRTFHDYGLRWEEGYALLFNAYTGLGGGWREVFPTNPFAPKKAGAVQVCGWELEMHLESRFLIPRDQIGNYRSSQW
jgi:hypothetical protein